MDLSLATAHLSHYDFQVDNNLLLLNNNFWNKEKIGRRKEERNSKTLELVFFSFNVLQPQFESGSTPTI